MLDNTKFLTYNQMIINRMLEHSDFVVCKPKNNYYHSFKHEKYGKKLSLDFRKTISDNTLIGYRHLEINISPHYHHNQYKHNGNDFTPLNGIKTVIEILNYLGIKPNEYNELNICNIEFGVNIIPINVKIKNLIDGLLFYKKTKFIVPDSKKPYYKESDTSKEKTIKAYAKGIQCHESLSVPEIDYNTFRFEIKYKKSRPLKRTLKKENVTAIDLLNLETYNQLEQTLLDEWKQILLINLEPDLKALKSDEVQFITDAKNIDFWCDLYRVKFGRYKQKYFNLLQTKNNLHTQIKNLITTKINTFLNVTFSPQKNTINKGKINFTDYVSRLIKCENVTQSKKY